MRAELRPSVQRILEGMTGTPAYARNSRTDIVAANSLCFALYAGVLRPEMLPLNLARLMFLDPRSKDFFLEWDTLADDLAAGLCAEAGRSPHDRALNSLIGDLATGSTEFSTRWARHNVRFHRSATKTLHSPLVGDIELTGDSLELPGEGLTLIAYTAEPGSRIPCPRTTRLPDQLEHNRKPSGRTDSSQRTHPNDPANRRRVTGPAIAQIWLRITRQISLRFTAGILDSHITAAIAQVIGKDPVWVVAALLAQHALTPRSQRASESD